MFFSNVSLPLYKRIFFRYFGMPFYAVIFRTSKSGAIAVNWEIARGLRDAAPNSYAKKFDTREGAEKYIKDFNFRIVDKAENSNNDTKGVKRKRLESSNNSISLLEDHIKKIKTAFNDLQGAVALFSGLPSTCMNQIKILNDEVIGKLHKILNVNETKSAESVSLAFTSNLHGRLEFADQKDLSSTLKFDDIDGINLDPSELDAAKKSFKFNEKEEVIVYTDGACSNNGHKGACAGAGIWFGHSHPLNLAIKVPGIQTNNNAEIFSVIKAIELVKATGLTKVSIHTDSDFVIKSIKEWLPRWLANGWKTSTGAGVKNKEMFMILHKKIKSMDSVSWTHVPGHKGITGNEEADELARKGAKM